MPLPPADKPTRCGVNVLTWGTETDGGNGMWHFLDTKFFGGNVGHAAIQLVFPADEEGDRLVKQYCEASETHAGLPVVKRHYVTPSAPSANNTETEKSPAYSEEVYEVYWSWWPKRLVTSSQEDNIEARKGRHFSWNKKWEDIIKPEKRIHRGKIGEKQVSYGPRSILHVRNLDKDRTLALQEKLQREKMEDTEEALILLKMKLQEGFREDSTEKTPSQTEKNLLDRFIPQWQESLKEKDKISKKEATSFRVMLDHILADQRNYQQAIKYVFLIDLLNPIKEQLKNDSGFTIDEDFDPSTALFFLLKDDEDLDFLGSSRPSIIKILENPELLKQLKYRDFVLKAIKVYEEKMLPKLRENRFYREHQNKKDHQDPLLETFRSDVEKHRAFEFFDNMDTEDMPESFSEENLERSHLTMGNTPDGIVYLPIALSSDKTTGLEGGLDVEGMLKKMQTLSSSDAEIFDLNRKNCSKTTDAILEAGATQDYQKDFFRAKVFGFFGTPQETFNHAQLFQKALAQGKPGILRQALAFNPLQRMRGACVRQIMDKQNGRTQKTRAVMGLVLLSPFLAFTFSIKRILDPLGTFSMAARGFDFARSRQFRGSYKILQGFMLIGTGSLAAVLSPLALVQWTLKTTLSNTAAFLRKSFSPKKMPATKNADSSETATDTLVAHERSLKEHAFSEKIKHLEIHIHEKHVADILHRFERILDHDKNAIPVLSKISENKLLAFIHKNPSHKVAAQYYQLSEKAQKRIMDIQSRLQAGESIEPIPQPEHLLHALHQHKPKTTHNPHTGHHLHAFHTHTKVARLSEDQPTHTKPRKPIIPPRKPV